MKVSSLAFDMRIHQNRLISVVYKQNCIQNFGSEKNVGSEKNFGSKKNFGSEKNVGAKKNFWFKTNLGSKKHFLLGLEPFQKFGVDGYYDKFW